MDKGTLIDWYITSVSGEDEPVWTEKYINELLGNFYLIPRGDCLDCNNYNGIECDSCEQKNNWSPILVGPKREAVELERETIKLLDKLVKDENISDGPNSPQGPWTRENFIDYLLKKYEQDLWELEVD